jgi:hypothetical protein
MGFKLIPNKPRKGYVLENVAKSTGLLKDFLKKVEKESEDVPMPH